MALIADSDLNSVTSITADTLIIVPGGISTALTNFNAAQIEGGSVLISWELNSNLADAHTNIYRTTYPEGSPIKISEEDFIGPGPHEIEDQSIAIRNGGEFTYRLVQKEETKEITLGSISIKTASSQMPKSYKLYQNYHL